MASSAMRKFRSDAAIKDRKDYARKRSQEIEDTCKATKRRYKAGNWEFDTNFLPQIEKIELKVSPDLKAKLLAEYPEFYVDLYNLLTSLHQDASSFKNDLVAEVCGLNDEL